MNNIFEVVIDMQALAEYLISNDRDVPGAPTADVATLNDDI